MVPVLFSRYRTSTIEVAFGATDDAQGVLALAALAPERFRRLAVLSPAPNPEDFDLLEQAQEAPAAVYVDWSEYELCLRDENTDHRASAIRIVEHFRALGCEVVTAEVPQGAGFASWSARLGRVLPFLLPRN